MNFGGGAIWPMGQLREVVEVARARGLALHIDGARLMNAAVASGVPAPEHARSLDSVWIDFTKGLGCPVGAVHGRRRDFVERAWRLKQRWGGAMRQSGVLAAMCLYALDHNVERLAEDHRLARRIGERVGDMRGVAGVLPVETNIVILHLSDEAPDSATVLTRLAERGIALGAFVPRRIRIVTHLDVDAAGADALEATLG